MHVFSRDVICGFSQTRVTFSNRPNCVFVPATGLAESIQVGHRGSTVAYDRIGGSYQATRGIAARWRPRRSPRLGLYPDNGSNDVLHTGAPDPPNLSCGADVGDGIAVDQYEVGPSAGFDHASVV